MLIAGNWKMFRGPDPAALAGLDAVVCPPFTRLHDCGWPNPYVVDHHVVFPNPNADPALPESYDFRLTDEYLAAVRQTGAEPIYRLG